MQEAEGQGVKAKGQPQHTWLCSSVVQINAEEDCRHAFSTAAVVAMHRYNQSTAGWTGLILAFICTITTMSLSHWLFHKCAHNHTITQQLCSIPAYILTLFVHTDLLQQRGHYHNKADLFYKAQVQLQS